MPKGGDVSLDQWQEVQKYVTLPEVYKRLDHVIHENKPNGEKAGELCDACPLWRKMGYEEDWRSLHQGGPTGYASREFLANLDSEGMVQVHQAPIQGNGTTCGWRKTARFSSVQIF